MFADKKPQMMELIERHSSGRLEIKDLNAIAAFQDLGFKDTPKENVL